VEARRKRPAAILSSKKTIDAQAVAVEGA